MDNTSAEQQARDMLVRMGYPSAKYASTGNVVELANLINNASRFEKDVVYMSVPRCETCRHWEANPPNANVAADWKMREGLGKRTPRWKATLDDYG